MSTAGAAAGSAVCGARRGEATEQEVADFLKEVSTREGELSEAELEGVAGGCNGKEAYLSVCTVGVGCAIGAIASAASDNMKGPDGRILCADAVEEG